MSVRALLLVLGVAALALPASFVRASAPSLAYSRVAGYQIAVTGAGWNPAATVTFSLLKGSIIQSIDLHPASDGSFTVGLNRVNICGLTAYAAKDTTGESAALHGAGVMCMQDYVPPPPGTAVLTVLRGQQIGSSNGLALAPRRLLTRYFADLSAHRYSRALGLESGCAVSFIPSPQSTGMVHLSAAAPNRPGALSSVRSAHITSISRFHLPALSAASLAGFHVSGTFQFVNPPRGLADGFNRIVVILRPCGGHWTVDPGWLSPAPYTWL